MALSFELAANMLEEDSATKQTQKKDNIAFAEIAIWDFDLTLTCHHTFETKKLCFPYRDLADKESYRLNGFNEKMHKFKAGLPIDPMQLMNVATFHNNPEYVLGLICQYFGIKPIVLSSSKPRQSGSFAVAQYQIEGMTLPITIAYMPFCGMEYQQRLKMTRFSHKDEQLDLLISVLSDTGLANQQTRYKFYDDTEANIRSAAERSDFEAYFVNPHNTVLETKLCDSTLMDSDEPIWPQPEVDFPSSPLKQPADKDPLAKGEAQQQKSLLLREADGSEAGSPKLFWNRSQAKRAQQAATFEVSDETQMGQNPALGAGLERSSSN